jgi:deazaflavin-dependent oxidoreductase (nitroreductase family)
MKSLLFRFMNWIAKQKAFQQRVPRLLRSGLWLMMAPYQLAGVYAMVLTTVGRKSGRPREVVITGTKLGEGFAIVAPFGPSGRFPDWYLNLKHNPQATMEIVWRKRAVSAEEVVDEVERAAVLRRYGFGMMDLEGAQERLEKKMPVIRLRLV